MTQTVADIAESCMQPTSRISHDSAESFLHATVQKVFRDPLDW